MEYILSNRMTFTMRGGLANCSTTERKQVEISNRSVKTGGIFYCEFLGDFFFDLRVAWVNKFQSGLRLVSEWLGDLSPIVAEDT